MVLILLARHTALISSGVYGYPKVQALQVAVDTIRAFLQDHDLTVYLVVFDRDTCAVVKEHFADMLAEPKEER